MTIFGPKPWVNPFRKMSIFRLSKLYAFSWPILPKKKKVGKMAIFGPKPWVNSFGKMSISGLFELLVLIA